APPSTSRDLLGDTILFRGVQIGSSAVYQCNASNQHGYLLANAFVSVLDMPPRMLGAKNQLIKVIVNNRTFLNCPFFGSPLPELRWFKNGQGSKLDGGQYRVYNNGTLEIKRARKEDEGKYTCVATNILGKADNRVELVVKEPTRIIQAPKDQSVVRGSEASFHCKVESNDLPYKVTWTKDGELVYLGWRYGGHQATDIQRPPRAQEPQENHRWDYCNPPREEQGRVPGKPPSSHSAEATGSCSNEPTGPSGSCLRPSRSSHGPRDPRHITPQAEACRSPGVQAPASNHRDNPKTKTPAKVQPREKTTHSIQVQEHARPPFLYQKQPRVKIHTKAHKRQRAHTAKTKTNQEAEKQSTPRSTPASPPAQTMQSPPTPFPQTEPGPASGTGTQTRNQNPNQNHPGPNDGHPHPRPTTHLHPRRKPTPTPTFKHLPEHIRH
ncbi:hypothetical protein ILYODFUR_025571, partial [Ilyodon furcidens]